MTTPDDATADVKRGKRWLKYTLLGAIAYAAGALFGSVLEKHWGFAVNETDSLPQKIFFLEKGKLPKRGDYAFFVNPGKNTYYSKDQRYVKQVVGVEDDVALMLNGMYIVTRSDNGADTVIGLVLEKDEKGRPLKPGATGRIPAGYYIMRGTHPRSLDSRYETFGWVKMENILGVAHPVF